MKPGSHFEKFMHKKKGSALKEEIRQEKRKLKKERAERIETRKAEARAAKASQSRPSDRRMPVEPVRPKTVTPKADEKMPLNKYIAHCGICSRREAAELVKEGKVKVNDAVVTEPGYKLNASDVVKYAGKTLYPARNLVYILLNKPKDTITTASDTHGRKTVLDLVKRATRERIYPVGRLDRNTTGVLILTNDGELTQKLSHPSHEVRKTYEAKLDRPLAKADFDKIVAGVTLEDGPVAVDALGYADAKDKSVVGIELHSGKNRVVRRLFESLGYEVRGLDRVMFANLTKKNVDRGKWRHLTEKEVRLLKFMNQSFLRKTSQPSAPKRKL
jgi:23S rRNA pseudouridine2605 synthase